MIADMTLAERVSTLMLEASGALNEAARLIGESGCSKEEKQKLFLAIGGAMGKIGTEVLNPLYRAHPEIKPAEYMLPEDFSSKT